MTDLLLATELAAVTLLAASGDAARGRHLPLAVERWINDYGGWARAILAEELRWLSAMVAD